ncbi:MAG: GAF domain-containing protein [Chitinophagaceae bacterium]|nr:GAF domain-containing protein [Anaerolineae bacterium]
MLRSINQNRLTQPLSYALALLAVIILITNLPSGDAIATYGGRLLLYGGLMALAMFFAFILADSEFSAAHAIGILAFLALPEDATPAALWAITLGSLLSGLIIFVRSHNRDTRHPRLTWSGLFFVVAQQTLSFYLAAQLYVNLGGILPLKRDTWDFDLPSAFMLGLYCLAYIVLYVVFFLIEFVPLRRVRQSDIVPILTVLFLPIPFAILAAVIANQLSAPLEVISVFGLMLIIIGLYAVSNSEFRLRRQLDELRTLSVVTRAMRAHLNLDALLKTVYLQVAHLLNTDDFTVALFNPDRNRLDFPLVIRRGEEDNVTDIDERPAIYGDLFIQHVMNTGTPLLISENVPETARMMGLALSQKPPASWVGVPLLAGGRSLGVISVKSDDPRRSFRPEDLRLLNIVAASASIAIENAQLYRQQTERAEQLSILNNIAQLLSGTLSPDSVLDTIISSASALSQANAVAVYVFMDATAREENDPYIRVAGLDEKFSALPLLLRQPEIPLARQMPIAIADVMTDRRSIDLRSALARENIAALVELPLVMGETGLGVIVVYFKDTQYFSGDRLEVLRTFATQAGDFQIIK